MQFEIKITFDQDISEQDVLVQVDNQTVDFEVNGCVIQIQCNSSGLLHLLKLTNRANKKIVIQQVLIDGCDLRKLIYLSWIQTSNGQRFQPATAFWEPNQIWTLPFGYPLSGWLEQVERKIPNDLFGKNLFDYFNLLFPECIELDHRFPRMVRDFYKHNFSFTALAKDQPVNMPWLRYTKSIDQTLVRQARQEIIDGTDYIMEHGLSYGQYESNLVEFAIENNANCWRRVWLTQEQVLAPAGQRFPKVQHLIDSLNLDYWYSFIGFLPAGGFIYPHRDWDTFKQDTAEYRPYQGCTQLYIPVDWPANNWIKFAGAGAVTLASGQPMVINNDAYSHCLVNASDQPRIVIGIRCHKKILADCDVPN